MTCWELAPLKSMILSDVYIWENYSDQPGAWSAQNVVKSKGILRKQWSLFFSEVSGSKALLHPHLITLDESISIYIYLYMIYTWNPTANQFLMDGGLVISNHGTHVKIWFITIYTR